MPKVTALSIAILVLTHAVRPARAQDGDTRPGDVGASLAPVGACQLQLRNIEIRARYLSDSRFEVEASYELLNPTGSAVNESLLLPRFARGRLTAGGARVQLAPAHNVGKDVLPPSRNAAGQFK